MTAIVVVNEITGTEAVQVYTVKDDGANNSRYYTADDKESSLTTNPIPIPNDVDAGLSGSYWKTHCLNVTLAPTTYIENVRFYIGWDTTPVTQWTLGTNGDHIICISSVSVADAQVYTNGMASSQYDQADGTEGTCGYFLSGNTDRAYDHTFYSGCTNGHYVSSWNFSSQATSMMVYSGQINHNGSSNSVGHSWCVVTQVLVGSGATQGAKTDVTATWVYDEV